MSLETETTVPAGGPQQIEDIGSTDSAGTGSKSVPRRRKKKQGSAFNPKYADLDMKVYPILESDLFQLAAISIGAVLCFAAASSCFSFALDIHKDLTLSTGVAPATISFWAAIRTSLFIAAGFLGLSGIGFVVWRGMVVSDIRNRAKFDEDDDE